MRLNWLQQVSHTGAPKSATSPECADRPAKPPQNATAQNHVPPKKYDRLNNLATRRIWLLKHTEFREKACV